MEKEFVENLTAAVSNGRTDIVRSLISASEKSSNEGQASVIDMLNDLNTQHGTLLHLATKLDHVDIVRTLLSAGANPGMQNKEGETPLDLVATDRMAMVYAEELLKATAQSDIGRIIQLLQAGVSVNAQDCPSSGNTALHWGASFSNVDVVQCLLDYGADVNTVNGMGATPLHDAVQRGDIRVVEKLLDAGANPFVKAVKGKFAGKSPVDLADENSEIYHVLCSVHIGTCEDGHDVADIQSLSLESLASADHGNLTPSVSRLSLTSGDSPSRQESFVTHQTAELPTLMPLATSHLPLVTDSRLHLLWPQPRRIVQTEGHNFVPKEQFGVHFLQSTGNVSVHAIQEVWEIHRTELQTLGYQLNIDGILAASSSPEARIICLVNPALFAHSESYRVAVTSSQIRIIGGDLVGLHQGINSVMQLLRLYSREEGIPTVFIDDSPSLKHRGVLIDVSSEARIPTLETLKGQIDILSSMKINQLHLYVRFALRDNWQVPYSNKDLLELDYYCCQRFVTVVPTLDIGGHVAFDQLPEVYRAFQDLLACFSCLQSVHIGPQLSRLLLNPQDENHNLQDIWRLLPLHPGTVIYLNTSCFKENANQIQNVPLNIILVEYGHEASMDYNTPCKSLTQSGSTMCLCAGTSSWNSIAGCPEATVSNIYRAVQAASSHNLLGLIIADWSGVPHHTATTFSWPGYVTGAGLAWNSTTHWDYIHSRLGELMNRFVLLDSEDVLGQVVVELGRAETYILRASRSQGDHDITNLPDPKATVLQQMIVDPDSVCLENLTIDIFQKAVRHIKRCQLELHKAKVQCFQSGEVISELQMAVELMLFACRIGRLLITIGQNPDSRCGVAVINAGLVNLPPTSRTDLANKLIGLTEQFRAVWLSRHLPPGLHASLLIFNNILNRLIPDCTQTHSHDSGVLE
ncbi:uncharacterized protein LOC143226079 isoform X1 [Tachypleus tridentatus]|uniref:uncharacterized protein LOC143226079 isoform X1 n=2 Tax=Tachypleus tridentatus TaxID=6853 RepID=UPI003FD55E47